MRIVGRGRIAQWSKEQLDKLSTLELRALLVNAERLKETEVAALCNELLSGRPHGHRPVRRAKHAASGRRLVTRRKAFEMHGVTLGNRVWSRGGVRPDGAVVLALRADEVQKTEGADSYLLWAPNIDDSHPWSDTAGGQERLEHCRMALERGVAEGLLIYGTSADPMDAEHVLDLRIEQRGQEYWAISTSSKRVAVVTHE
jgi:hypothetical protein